MKNNNTIVKIILRLFCLPTMFIVSILLIPFYIITGKNIIVYFERYYHYHMRSDWTENER